MFVASCHNFISVACRWATADASLRDNSENLTDLRLSGEKHSIVRVVFAKAFSGRDGSLPLTRTHAAAAAANVLMRATDLPLGLALCVSKLKPKTNHLQARFTDQHTIKLLLYVTVYFIWLKANFRGGVFASRLLPNTKVYWIATTTSRLISWVYILY